MTQNHTCRNPVCTLDAGRTAPQRAGVGRLAAFSLIELLTVIFIISLLIGVLLPSINSARNAAKKATTSKTLQSIRVGLEMFKNENGSEFRLTNGYPPSFQHPRIPGYAGNDLLHEGRFPFSPGSKGNPPIVYGAHWLPAMLMGVDNLGYVKRSTVPNKNNLRREPWLWYTNDPLSAGRPLERQQLYIDPGNVRTRRTEELTGQPNSAFFPGWNWDSDNPDRTSTLLVIVDAFDQPVLYYAAGTHGRATNMLEDIHLANNNYSRGTPQLEGTPFFFHQDNEGFTGTENAMGWNFGGRILSAGAVPDEGTRLHSIAKSGAELTADQVIDPVNRETFARYIIDRKIFESVSRTPTVTAPLRPVNADTYLLITAGTDGRYGTNDDVTNLPPWPD